MLARVTYGEKASVNTNPRLHIYQMRGEVLAHCILALDTDYRELAFKIRSFDVAN